MEFPESDNRQNGFFFVASIPKPVKAGFFHERTVSAHIPERLILRTSLRGVIPACFRPFNGEPQPAENATIAEAIEFGGRSLPAAAQLRVVAARPDTSFREARCRSALDPDCNYPNPPRVSDLRNKCTVNRLSRSGQPGAAPGEGLQPAVLPSLARGFNLQIKSTFFIRVGRPGDRPECARVAGLPMGRRPARPLTRELIFNRMLFTQRNSVKTGGAENPAFILYNADRIRTCRQARRISAPRCVPGLPDGHRAVRTGCLTMKS